jgi:hypothetical protein
MALRVSRGRRRPGTGKKVAVARKASAIPVMFDPAYGMPEVLGWRRRSDARRSRRERAGLRWRPRRYGRGPCLPHHVAWLHPIPQAEGAATRARASRRRSSPRTRRRRGLHVERLPFVACSRRCGVVGAARPARAALPRRHQQPRDRGARDAQRLAIASIVRPRGGRARRLVQPVSPCRRLMQLFFCLNGMRRSGGGAHPDLQSRPCRPRASPHLPFRRPRPMGDDAGLDSRNRRGVTGAGIALDAPPAALRSASWRPLDWSLGSSSRSWRLVQGGLRYLTTSIS